jgi:CRISPR-associated exonuclease Cas4
MGVSADDDYLAISALQHYAYCPRQFALIHIEQAWAENRFTSEGRVLHERVDAGPAEQRRGVRYERAVSLISHRLRLTGKMDLLEIEKSGDQSGLRYLPVEYKRGKPKLKDWDRIQLCAQALCIEEMRDTAVAEGAIWYWEVRRREAVSIDEALRATTLAVIEGARSVLVSGATPPPVNDRRCRACSLIDVCGPATFVRDRTAAYVERMYTDGEADDEGAG